MLILLKLSFFQLLVLLDHFAGLVATPQSSPAVSFPPSETPRRELVLRKHTHLDSLDF